MPAPYSVAMEEARGDADRLPARDCASAGRSIALLDVGSTRSSRVSPDAIVLDGDDVRGDDARGDAEGGDDSTGEAEKSVWMRSVCSRLRDTGEGGGRAAAVGLIVGLEALAIAAIAIFSPTDSLLLPATDSVGTTTASAFAARQLPPQQQRISCGVDTASVAVPSAV